MKFLDNLTPEQLLSIHKSLETVLDIIDPVLTNCTDCRVSALRNIKWEAFKLYSEFKSNNEENI